MGRMTPTPCIILNNIFSTSDFHFFSYKMGIVMFTFLFKYCIRIERLLHNLLKLFNKNFIQFKKYDQYNQVNKADFQILIY